MDGLELTRIPRTASVVYHPYRTATVHDVFVKIPRNEVVVQKLQDQFCAIVERSPDNHVCYEVRFDNGHTLYYMFSDLTLRIGLSIKKGFW